MAVPDRIEEDWIGAYHGLLAASGLAAARVLSEALSVTASAPDRIATASTGDAQSLSLAQCLAEPERLVEQIRQDYPASGDARLLRAHLSVLQQDLALSVIAPLVLRLFRDGEAPLPEEERIFLAPLSSSAPAGSRWRHEPRDSTVDVEQFVTLVGHKVSAWYPVFRKSLGVSPGAFWSSIGLGLGAPYSAVWNRADAPEVCRQAQQWLMEFDCDGNRFIDWIPASFNGQTCALPQRKGCCLKYLLPDGGYCGTCGVYRKTRLAQLKHPGQTPRQWQPEQ